MKTLKELIGYELKSIDDKEMVVSKDGKEYTVCFKPYDVDYCAYASVEANLLVDGKSNPVITDVQYVNDDSCDADECVKITFFGLDKEIAIINAQVESGSGYMYGACVDVYCKPLEIEETIVEW